MMDRDTDRSKGFGFVEMDNGDQAQAAISALICCAALRIYATRSRRANKPTSTN
ncbi:MAG TPA: hypothetical protein VG099_12025 [Gemmataceae bacterium]|nr:hypothetical protein [Gemmataceae bacterium]